MNPKQFLTLGGITLVLVGVLGYFGPIGPEAVNSIFGDMWYFDKWENIVHTILGVVALLAAFTFPASIQKPLVIVVGLVALYFAYYSGVVSSDYYGYAMLQNPADTILHIVVGVWALWSALRKDSMMA